jgi:hypothetical protein
MVSDESQDYPKLRRMVTHSSGAWPYEAMERGLAMPAVRRRKTGGEQESKIDRIKNSGI